MLYFLQMKTKLLVALLMVAATNQQLVVPDMFLHQDHSVLPLHLLVLLFVLFFLFSVNFW